MTMELLPNEILIECFRYLTGWEVFHAFDGLNYRFNELIRSIRLSLDFHDVEKSIFDRFRMKLVTNPEIKGQIHSLKLCNYHMTGQIQKFLFLFSLNQFCQLRSLTLTRIQENDVNKLRTMLSYLSELSCFRLINPESGVEKLLCVLSRTKIQTLSVLQPFIYLVGIHRISSLGNLTLSYCSFHRIAELLQYTPRLKYLDIHGFGQNEKLDDESIDRRNRHVTQLKTLIIRDFFGEIDALEGFVQSTPNLEVLTITRNSPRNFIDAHRWEMLITSSLLHLNIFRFYFELSSPTGTNALQDKFEQFQTDFWCKQYHWYTEYTFSKLSARIYTIPYIMDRFTIQPYNSIHSKRLLSNAQTFDHVKTLVVYQQGIFSTDADYFSNVTTLILHDDAITKTSDHRFLDNTHIHRLRMIVNLSHIKHLTISSAFQLKTTSVLLQLLEQTKQLSSLAIDVEILPMLFTDHALCKCLEEKNKKLDICEDKDDYDSSPVNSFMTEQVFQVFFNLEQLQCRINHPNDILVALNGLAKLSNLKVLMRCTGDIKRIASSLIDVKPMLNSIHHIDTPDIFSKMQTEGLFIWIGRNVLLG